MLEFYDRNDIAQSIISITVAMLSASIASGAPNVEYCRGVVDTARAHALNYGISWPGLIEDMCEALDGRGKLLELVALALPGGETCPKM